MAIVENVPGKCRVHITKFEEPDAYVEQRIGGWIERAIEISGAKSCRVNLAQSLAKGDPLTEFVVTWS